MFFLEKWRLEFNIANWYVMPDTVYHTNNAGGGGALVVREGIGGNQCGLVWKLI